MFLDSAITDSEIASLFEISELNQGSLVTFARECMNNQILFSWTRGGERDDLAPGIPIIGGILGYDLEFVESGS